jgi:hypothetical protein
MLAPDQALVLAERGLPILAPWNTPKTCRTAPRID